MKVLFDTVYPSFLAHGGVQIQIAQTMRHLEREGVETAWIHPEDAGQKGDVIHYFGFPPSGYFHFARQKKIPMVVTNLLSASCNYPLSRLRFQAGIRRIIGYVPYFRQLLQATWAGGMKQYPCVVVNLRAEKQVLTLNGVPEDRVHVIPCGCEDVFLEAEPSPLTGDYLISHGTISSQKRIVELARMGVSQNIPLFFIGKPYSTTDPCLRELEALMEKHPHLIRYRSHVESREELIRLLQGARGYVLFSEYENWCISADEAIACGLPVLLPDLPWSRERFSGTSALFFHSDPTDSRNGAVLKNFYETGTALPPLPKPISWDAVARQLKSLYETEIAAANRG